METRVYLAIVKCRACGVEYTANSWSATRAECADCGSNDVFSDGLPCGICSGSHGMTRRTLHPGDTRWVCLDCARSFDMGGITPLS